MDLQIAFDDDVSNELRPQAASWLQECIDWLIQQPPSPVARPPHFEIRKFRIGLHGWNKGLQHSKTGEGWSYYQLSNVLTVMTRPYQRFQASMKDATQATWIFGLSQHRSDQSFEDDDFIWEFHEAMQRKWIQEHLPDVAKAVRLKRLSGQRAEKHKLQLQKQKADRQPKPPKRYAPHYSAPPAPLPPQPPAAPIQHPKPVLSAQDKRALEILENHQLYMASFCTTDCTTEDHDK